jgi:nitrate reductase NapE component
MISVVEGCITIILVSITSVVAMGSFCFVCGMTMMLFGRDID